jgi:hypothetical protein
LQVTQTDFAQTSTTTQVIHPPFDFPIGDLREHELLLVVSIATAHKDLILEKQTGSLVVKSERRLVEEMGDGSSASDEQD